MFGMFGNHETRECAIAAFGLKEFEESLNMIGSQISQIKGFDGVLALARGELQ